MVPGDPNKSFIHRPLPYLAAELVNGVKEFLSLLQFKRDGSGPRRTIGPFHTWSVHLGFYRVSAEELDTCEEDANDTTNERLD